MFIQKIGAVLVIQAHLVNKKLDKRCANNKPFAHPTLAGSEETAREVEAFHRGVESNLHLLGRSIKAGEPVKKYNFADVGYNFMIASNGTIYEGRSLQFEAAHVLGKNPGNIGIAFLGDYSDNPLSKAQVISAEKLIQKLNDVYSINSSGIKSNYIYTHAQFDANRLNELAGAKKQIAEIRAKIYSND